MIARPEFVREIRRPVRKAVFPTLDFYAESDCNQLSGARRAYLRRPTMFFYIKVFFSIKPGEMKFFFSSASLREKNGSPKEREDDGKSIFPFGYMLRMCCVCTRRTINIQIIED